MNLLLAVVIAILFGTGVYLILKEDLTRMAVGLNLASSAVILFLVAAGLLRGRAPIYPIAEDVTVSDPLVQALALTAVVISFAIQTLVLTLIFSVYMTHRSLDQEELRQVEAREVSEIEGKGSMQ